MSFAGPIKASLGVRLPHSQRTRPQRLLAYKDPEANRYGFSGGQELSESQRAFLDRKKKADAGEEYQIPSENFCKSCEGQGEVTCVACGGEGLNGPNAREEGQDMYAMSPTTPATLFQEGLACWLCRGTQVITCKDCRGMGLTGAWEEWQFE